MENNGEKDEDVYVTLNSDLLGINLETSGFELKKGKEINKEFVVNLPEDVKTADYDLEAVVYFGSKSNNKVVKFSVKDEEIIRDTIKPLQTSISKPSEEKIEPISVKEEITDDILSNFIKTQSFVINKVVDLQRDNYNLLNNIQLPSLVHAFLFLIIVGLTLTFLYYQI